jgi:hypothetical protein
VTWSAPASNGGSPVTGYKVTGSPAGNASVTASTTSATLTGLTNNTRECVQVQALNAVGAGAFSPSGTSCATPFAPSVPNEVTNLSVDAGDDQITVSWNAAKVPAGSPSVTGYQVTVTPPPSGGSGTRSTSPSTTSVTVPGLTGWQKESVSVVAENSVGKSAAATGSGVPWTRSKTVTCYDDLSDDYSVQNDCSNTGGAWSTQDDAIAINWVNPQNELANLPSSFNEFLCSTYVSNNVSGDVYALSTSASQSSCESLLSDSQNPTEPHVIAAVSTSPLPGGQEICEYQGTTKTTSGTFTESELNPCSDGAPSHLPGSSVIARFYV